MEMLTEPVSAHTHQMAQMRISQLELENKMLKDQLKAFELKYGPLDGTAPKPQGADSMSIDSPGSIDLETQKAEIFSQRDEAKANFLALLDKFKKRLTTDIEDEHMATEESFRMPSALNTQDTEESLDSPAVTPLSTQ